MVVTLLKKTKINVKFTWKISAYKLLCTILQTENLLHLKHWREDHGSHDPFENNPLEPKEYQYLHDLS